MSVLSRHHTIPKPRTSGDPLVDLDAPVIKTSSQTPTSGPSRTALLVSGAAIITAAAAGTTVYVLADDSSAPSQTVELPFPSSELQRDAAAASRNGAAAAVANTEAQRDAAAAARNASR